MEDIEEGVKIGGRLVKEVRFANDQEVTSSIKVGLQRLMDGLVSAAKDYNMKVNVKTKVMKAGRTSGGAMNIFIKGGKVEHVSKFKYLGSWITEDGRTETEVKARIGMGEAAFNRRKELLKNK